MKKSILILIVIVVLALIGVILAGFGGTDTDTTSETSKETLKEEETQNNIRIPEGETLGVVTEESEVLWKGRKHLLENYVDTGSLSLKEGFFNVENQTLLGGRVVFDMNSIKALGTGLGKGETNLENHLKSSDWFSIEEYPTAEFVITEVETESGSENVILKGSLTIKGITQNVSIPANVSWDDETLTVSGNTDLDRTLWDLKYGSGKFFEDLADQVINDLFSVEFKAVAKKSN